MNSRHTTPCLAIALSIALLLSSRSGVNAEEAGATFLKVGSFYRIVSVGAVSEPRSVKILEPAGGQWYRVETVRSRPAGDGTSSYEQWINFANVLSVTEIKEPEKTEPEKKEPRVIK